MSPASTASLKPARRFRSVSESGSGAPLQLRPTRANGQPAFGYYLRSQPLGVMVLTLSGSKVDQITFFSDPSLPGRFGLPGV